MKRLSLLLMLFMLFAVGAYANKVQVMKVSKEVVTAMKNRDMAKLSALVHPVKGVRFTPYNYVDRDSDRVFTKNEIARIWNSKKLYLWGEFDGSGDPMSMRFSKYFNAFVYDRDFANAPSVRYGAGGTRGNSINNLAEAYPKAKVVEYHFERGPAPQYNEMGWESLHLVFEKSGKKWFLVGVSHDQWTI